MGLFDTATNAASTPIVPQDRFIFECLSIGEQPPYAPPGEQPKPGARPGIKWTFGLFFASSGEPFYFQDDPYEFFQSTTANMQRGARAREYAEALLGRELGEGEQVNPNELIGKRALGMVIWELSRNDKTKKVAKLVAPEPYREAVATKAPSRAANGAATAVMERPSASQVSADASEEDIDWALLVSKVEKKIAQAVKLQTGNHLEWAALDLRQADADQLQMILNNVQADIDAD